MTDSVKLTTLDGKEIEITRKKMEIIDPLLWIVCGRQYKIHIINKTDNCIDSVCIYQKMIRKIIRGLRDSSGRVCEIDNLICYDKQMYIDEKMLQFNDAETEKLISFFERFL